MVKKGRETRGITRLLARTMAGVLVMTTFSLRASRVVGSPPTIYVPDDYSTIQAPADAARPGDTIIVRHGTYTENVDVNNEHLTIQSEDQADTPTGPSPNRDDHVSNEGKADNYPPIETLENYQDRQILFIHDGSKSTHSITNTEWNGYSDLAAILRGKGFTVDEQNLYQISLDDLVNYDVVVFASLWESREINSSEAAALASFVQDGGGLLLLGEYGLASCSWSDEWDNSVNMVGEYFGIELELAMVCDPSDHHYFYSDPDEGVDSPFITDVRSHEVTHGISKFMIAWGTVLQVTSPAVAIAYTDNDAWLDTNAIWNSELGHWECYQDGFERVGRFAALAVSQYGSGKVVAIGDSSPFVNDWLDNYDHYDLAQNIFEWLSIEEPLVFTGTILAIYPYNHADQSVVMQGGTAYRHLRLTDSGGSPVPNATVTLSTGSTAISDASGYFTATIRANDLGGLGSHTVSVERVTYGGQTYSTESQPSFTVQVSERRYSYAWSYGASTRLKGGVSGGVIAYLYRTTSGGLELKLDESTPDATWDDIVLMKEDFSDEIGAGGGVGIEGEVSVLIVEIKGGASASSEWAIRTIGSTQARFPDPYSDNDRKAEAIFLLASVVDSIGQAFPGKPFAINFLKLGLDRAAPYRNYVSRQQAGLGSKITPLQANVGASASLGLERGGVTWKERLLGFDLVDVGVTVVQMNVLTDYRDRNEWGLSFESDHDVDWSLLSWQIGDFRNKFAGTIGDRAKKVKVELVFDGSTNAFKRLELSVTGEGNPYAFTDVLKEQVALKLIIPAEQLGSDRLSRTVNVIRLLDAAQQVGSTLLQIGPSTMVNELNNLLDGLEYVEYEVMVDDGAETHYETSLGVTLGIDIKLGPGLSVKKVRSLVRERGVFLNGHPYQVESYEADGYVSRPGKSWWDLTTNALGGLWLLVRDAFNWAWQQVTSGIGWVIGTVSRTVDGIIWGGAQVIAPPGTQLCAADIEPQAVTIQQTEAVTVTAMGWVPTSTVSISSLGLTSAVAAASGNGFVVGGIYDLQPYTLTVSPAATLVLTYTDQAAFEVDESRIAMFRWNAEGNNWQPMAATSDIARNAFTGTISQLGTFALGYDDQPPRISVLNPADGSTISNRLPLISALVVDEGTGVDPGTVEMQLNGQVVAHDYITGTGQVLYLPPEELANATYTVTLAAGDVVGNSASVTATFAIHIEYDVFLPVILKLLSSN